MIVTSGFLTALECTKFVFVWPGLRPGPQWGSLQRSPDHLAGLRGPTSKEKRRGGTGEKESGRERKGTEETPLSQIPESAPVDVAVYTALVLATDCNI